MKVVDVKNYLCDSPFFKKYIRYPHSCWSLWNDDYKRKGLQQLRACLVTSEESIDLMILHYHWNKDFLLEIYIIEDFTLILVCINAYNWEKYSSVYKSTYVRIFKSYWGRSNLKILTNEDSHSSKSSRVYNCETWIHHNIRKIEKSFS